LKFSRKSLRFKFFVRNWRSDSPTISCIRAVSRVSNRHSECRWRNLRFSEN
jgi:hypothetical protein